jgi:hypothetical protein
VYELARDPASARPEWQSIYRTVQRKDGTREAVVTGEIAISVAFDYGGLLTSRMAGQQLPTADDIDVVVVRRLHEVKQQVWHKKCLLQRLAAELDGLKKAGAADSGDLAAREHALRLLHNEVLDMEETAGVRVTSDPGPLPLPVPAVAPRVAMGIPPRRAPSSASASASVSGASAGSSGSEGPRHVHVGAAKALARKPTVAGKLMTYAGGASLGPWLGKLRAGAHLTSPHLSATAAC